MKISFYKSIQFQSIVRSSGSSQDIVGRQLVKLIKKYQIKIAPAELSIVFLSKPEIQKLNKQFLKKDQPTDVLSFQAVSSNEPNEIYISIPYIRSALKTNNRELILMECLRMIVHGILHIGGYDHVEKFDGAIDPRQNIDKKGSSNRIDKGSGETIYQLQEQILLELFNTLKL